MKIVYESVYIQVGEGFCYTTKAGNPMYLICKKNKNANPNNENEDECANCALLNHKCEMMLCRAGHRKDGREVHFEINRGAHETLLPPKQNPLTVLLSEIGNNKNNTQK